MKSACNLWSDTLLGLPPYTADIYSDHGAFCFRAQEMPIRMREFVTLRILVVEDDIRMLELLCRGLREAGHAVMPASDGQAALDKLSTQVTQMKGDFLSGNNGAISQDLITINQSKISGHRAFKN